ncbi:MAG: hypothetical protein AAFN11_22195, partial [Chloroflexota bacterium]
MTKQYKFEQFTATRLHGAVEYSHDGTQIAYTTNASGQFNIWIVPAGGGFARQLTAFEDWAVRSLHWSNDDSKIAFVADKDGSENRQVFIIDSAGGWHEMLSDKLDRQYDLAGWSPDDSKLLYTANDAQPGEKDPIEHDLATGELRRMMTGHLNFATGYSPDGKYINVVQFNGNTDQNVLVLEVESGEAALATPHEGETRFAHLDWHPDSSGFFMLTNDGREFANVAYYDLKTGKRDWYYTGEHDVEGLVANEDANRVLVFINNGGRTELKAFALDSGEPVKVADLPVGVLQSGNISPDGTKLVLNYSSSKAAGNIYEFDLATGELIA